MTSTAFADVPLPPFIQKILDQGAAKGRREGKTEGKAEGKAEAIVELLEIRGVSVSDAIRAEVLACTDLATLDHWFHRAAKLKSAAAVVRSRPAR